MSKLPRKSKAYLKLKQLIFLALEDRNIVIVWQLDKMDQSIHGDQAIKANLGIMMNGHMQTPQMSRSLD